MTFGRQRDRDRSRTLVRRDALGLAALALLLLLSAPALCRAQGADSLVVRWTAPGDDGNVGTAAYYELRVAMSPLTPSNFLNGLVVPGTPDPSPAGTRQTFVVRGLTRGVTYWLAMRTMDETGNWSAVSNIVRFDWPPDAAPPAAPNGFAGALATGWVRRALLVAQLEADLAGYRVYRALDPAGPWSRVATVGATVEQWNDTSLPAGADKLWYAVAAYDRSGGEGARAAALEVSLKSPTSPAPLAWGLEPAYPNPARGGALMRIPVDVPATGVAARVDLLDAAGRLVRRFDLGGAAPGVHTVRWTGRTKPAASARLEPTARCSVPRA